MTDTLFKIFNRYSWKLVKILGNLPLAIVLLLSIAALSSLGTIIEQDKTPIFYEINYPDNKPILGILKSDIIISLGLDHIYSTPWFILLLLLFGSSLASCTLSTQIPSLKLATLWKFLKRERATTNSGLAFTLGDLSLNELSYLLRKDFYNVIQQGPYLYAYKGLVGKVGPILVHASIICILLGSLCGLFGGFVLQELVAQQDIFHLQNIISSGPLSYVRQDIEGYVYDFKIAYSDEGIIDQFYSDLGILDDTLNLKFRKTIFVNEPLRYDGITFYQTDWGVKSLSLNINDKNSLQLSLREVKLENNSRFWVSLLPMEKNLLLIIQDLTGKCLIYDSNRNLLGETEIGHKFFVNGQSIRIQEILPSTGLQIKSDPGIPLVYFGFSFLILSVIFSYTSYFQLWATKKKDNLYIYANTNRAVYFYERNIGKLLDSLKLKN